MGRMYTASFENQSVTNANGDHEYFTLDPAAEQPVVLHAVYVSFNTEVGDAQEEMIRWAIVRGNTTLPGSTPNNTSARPLDPGDQVFDGVVEAFNTSLSSGGTAINIHADAFNLRVGLVWVPTPEMRPKVQNGELLCVQQLSTLTDDANASGTIYFEEL